MSTHAEQLAPADSTESLLGLLETAADHLPESHKIPLSKIHGGFSALVHYLQAPEAFTAALQHEEGPAVGLLEHFTGQAVKINQDLLGQLARERGLTVVPSYQELLDAYEVAVKSRGQAGEAPAAASQGAAAPAPAAPVPHVGAGLEGPVGDGVEGPPANAQHAPSAGQPTEPGAPTYEQLLATVAEMRGAFAQLQAESAAAGAAEQQAANAATAQQSEARG